MKGKGTLRTIKVEFPAALWRCGALVANGSRCEPWAFVPFVLALTPPWAARRMASRCCAQLGTRHDFERGGSRWSRRTNAAVIPLPNFRTHCSGDP